MFIYMCVFKSCAPSGCIILNCGFIFTSFVMLYKQEIYTPIDNIGQCINICSSLGGITKLVPIRKFERNTSKLGSMIQDGAAGHNFERGPFRPSLVEIDQVVYDEKILKLFFCLFILNLHNRSKSAKVKSSYKITGIYGNMLKSS